MIATIWGEHLRDRLTVEAYLLALCAGKTCGPTFAMTQYRLIRRWREDYAGGASTGEWRAFHRRHPDAMRQSSRGQIRELSAQFDAENASAAARAAVEIMLDQHKPPR